MAQTTAKSRGILLIALFKLFKGILLALVAFGTLRLIHRDIHETLLNWTHHLHIDPGGHRANALIGKVSGVSLTQLKEIAAGEIFYAGLLLTEGIGLLLRRRWAEYITVISTALFIPLEIYELVEKLSPVKLVVLAINVAIVWYLIVRLRSAESRGPVAED